jgi:carbon monoxide dehydrogenase subunit G
MRLTVGRDVAAPREAVWSVMTDLERWPAVLSGVARVERLDGGDRFDVGTRWAETRTMLGRESTQQMEVTAVEDGTAYTVTSTSGATTYTSVLHVETLGDARSRLTMTFGARTSGVVATVLGATLGRLFLGATRRMLEADLMDVAAAAEATAA